MYTRDKMSGFQVFLFVALTSLVFVPVNGEQIEYECSPQGVISVTNPNPAVYIWARANSSDTICTTNVISGKILIYDCFDRNLTLLLSDEAEMPTIIKAVHKTYTLSCTAIPAEGIVKKVVDETHVTHYLSTSIVPSRYVTITLNTTLFDHETGTVKTIAYIGEPFHWFIWGPENYKVKPLDCTTYSVGNDVEYSVDTHTDGCTLDESLMSDFRRYNASDNLIVADVYAFRFPGSDQLRLYCNVLGCPNISEDACTINCTSERKRRSDGRLNYSRTDKVMARTPGPAVYPPTLAGPQLPMSMHERRRMVQEKHGSVSAQLTVVGEPNVYPAMFYRDTSKALKISKLLTVFVSSLTFIYIKSHF